MTTSAAVDLAADTRTGMAPAGGRDTVTTPIIRRHPEGQGVTPRIDPKIPTLVNASQAAELIGISKQALSDLIAQGRWSIEYVEVGRGTLLAEVQATALADARREGRKDWAEAAALPRVPRLVNTTEFAELAGITSTNVAQEVLRAYERGAFPGVKVGRNLVLRADVALGYKAIVDAGGDQYPIEPDEREARHRSAQLEEPSER